MRKKPRRNAAKALGVSLAVGALGVCAYMALNGDHKDSPTSVPATVGASDTKTISALPVEDSAPKVEAENVPQIEDVSEANNPYEKALNLLVEAQALAAKEDYTQAIAKVEEALKSELTDGTRQKVTSTLEQYKQTAQAQSEKKAAEKKLADFEQAKKDVDGAALLNEQGKYTEAVAKLDSALKLLPVDEQYKETRAQWQATRNNYNKATEEQAAKALAEQRAAEQARKDAERKAAEQAAAAKAGAGGKAGELKTITVAGVEYRFRWCPAGSFTMGSPMSEAERDDDEKQHEVTLTRGFWMQETETTQEQWKSIMNSNPSDFKGDNLPVETVSWNDVAGANGFISRLNAKANGLRFRLPTEAEWEYASRGGANHKFSGSNNLGDVAWYGGNSDGKTHAVGTKTANGWGLHDMSGNVWEWCQDRYDSYSSDSATDPEGPKSGSNRVDRGGSWDGGASICRRAYRDYYDPEYGWDDVGFRLLLESVQ